MNHHLHDLARTMNAERTHRAAGPNTTNVPIDEQTRFRSIVGNVLIRAGTRLLPASSDRPGRMQSIPPG